MRVRPGDDPVPHTVTIRPAARARPGGVVGRGGTMALRVTSSSARATVASSAVAGTEAVMPRRPSAAVSAPTPSTFVPVAAIWATTSASRPGKYSPTIAMSAAPVRHRARSSISSAGRATTSTSSRSLRSSKRMRSNSKSTARSTWVMALPPLRAPRPRRGRCRRRVRPAPAPAPRWGRTPRSAPRRRLRSCRRLG